MATPITNVADYCGVLSRSRLMPNHEVTTILDTWRNETRAADTDVDSFRRYLVIRRYLTEYQAAMVQRGHAEGFFVGGYVILDRIGKGQTAGVYKAVHQSGQTVALKVLAASKARNPHMLGRFQREGRLLTQLKHPNIVRAFQLSHTAATNEDRSGVHYIVMEQIEGETLDVVLGRRVKLPATEAARIIHQALGGLQHLHEKRMVHRDMKPANLMMTPLTTDSTLSATVKILDIGLGRELFDDESGSTHDMHLTVEGTVLGTPDYLAPEQARDARLADIRADIYSLGCVLYHLLAGRPPFSEKNVMATMVKHATEQPTPISQLAIGVPPGLQIALNRMMAKDPSGRYSTPIEAADALRAFLPTNAQKALESAVLPGFQKWLESESSMELAAAKPMPAPRNGQGAIHIGADPVLAPAPRPSMSGPASGKIRASGGMGSPQSAGLTAPVATKPKPNISGPPSGKIKIGTGLAAALAGASVSPAQSLPASLKPPSVAGRPSPIPPNSPHLTDYDVELLPLSGALSAPADLAIARVEQTPPMRPLYDLDRRDFLMLGIGAGGVIGAIAIGIGVASINKNKLRAHPSETSE